MIGQMGGTRLGLLADESPSYQDPVGADAGLGGAQFGDGGDAWRD